MTEPVCNIKKKKLYINIDQNENKNIPIVYGTKKIKLIKISANQYVAVEKISNVLRVLDKDNNLLTSYTFNNSLITVNGSIEADTAIIIGYTNNKIGEIIKDLITKKTKIPYGLTNWNTSEVDSYINISPRINIEFNSGDVKNAIDEVLKSDMAYFIQQLNGKFTIRKYGETYNVHNLSPSIITKKPEKDYGKAQENYFSSCIINYQFTDKDTYKSKLFDDREYEAEKTYKKKVLKTFDTELVYENDVDNFAKLLNDRYILLKQKIKLAVGIDTSGMNLLDTVIIDLNINERKFSNITNYIITEINPSQDILVLEEIKCQQ
jgi:hypothetical protein